MPFSALGQEHVWTCEPPSRNPPGMNRQARTGVEDRDQRLKKALKDNLQKRKAQARVRAEAAPRATDSPVDPDQKQGSEQDG
jgi:hypothetical protein